MKDISPDPGGGLPAAVRKDHDSELLHWDKSDIRCAAATRQPALISARPDPTAWLGRQDSKLCIPNDRMIVIEPERFRRRAALQRAP
jgi:hypothetical protein